MNVLLTRPVNQVNKLTQLVEQFGYTPLCFTSLEIKPLTPSKPLISYDVLIFISANSVHYAKSYLPYLTQYQPMVATVGSITQTILENDYQIKVAVVPKVASSDALLALEAMRNLSGKKVLIVRGQGGLEILKTKLKQQNQVDYLEVYQRSPAILSTQHQQSLQQFLKQNIGIIIIHSVDSFLAFKRLVEQIDERLFNHLCHYPIVLMSHRIQKIVQLHGFIDCYVVKTANDKALLNTLEIVRSKYQ